tara:strand:- start:36301 stop:36924 length:624 start_codon:yes stop_codon:yes gene_type:complete
MHNANIPEYTELPTNQRLFRSTIIAVVSAVVILVTIVLPSEYGIDPTGIGSLTGLKRMGEIKTSLAEEIKADQQNPIETAGTVIPAQTEDKANKPVLEQINPATRTDTMKVTLAPNKSTEIKLTMSKDVSVEFSWSSDSGAAFYDLHGDSKDINYHIYEKGTETSKQGTLVAAFDGNHGWYWKNRSASPITITLTTTGDYQEIKEMN